MNSGRRGEMEEMADGSGDHVMRMERRRRQTTKSITSRHA